MPSLTFNGYKLNPVVHNSQIHLSSAELAKALGYAETDSVTKIYNRNSDEFSPNMTTTVKMTVVRKTGKVEMDNRIFSLRGCHLIAMFARTKVAKEFRQWVLDILDKEVGQPVMQTPTQRATATPTELQAIKTKVHFISSNFQFKGGASTEINNRLRVEFNLASIADIQSHQLDKAHQILDEIDRHAKAYAKFRYELDKQVQGVIIRQGRPYTPHIKAKLTKLGATIGHAPDWTALQTLIQ